MIDSVVQWCSGYLFHYLYIVVTNSSVALILPPRLWNRNEPAMGEPQRLSVGNSVEVAKIDERGTPAHEGGQAYICRLNTKIVESLQYPRIS